MPGVDKEERRVTECLPPLANVQGSGVSPSKGMYVESMVVFSKSARESNKIIRTNLSTLLILRAK